MPPNHTGARSLSLFLKQTLVVLALALTLGASSHAATIRVPQDQPTIAAGIAAANPGDTVAISPGTYRQTNALSILKNITLTSLGSATNTIIDFPSVGYVSLYSPPPATITLRGFTIQNAHIPDYTDLGAVNISSGKCRITGCIIQNTFGPTQGKGGAAIRNQGTNVDDVLVDSCVIRSNYCGGYGRVSGIYKSTALKCVLYRNGFGAALRDCNATNCTVWQNDDFYGIDGMAGGTAINCIFYNNAGSGSIGSGATNPVVTYSIVEGGFPGVGNLDIYPGLVAPWYDDFHLQTNSPAIDVGAPWLFDPDGTRSDIGAIPFAHVPCMPHPAVATATIWNGSVTAIEVLDPGCGYTNPPVVRIDGGGGTGATATALIDNGLLTAVVLTDPGAGYTNAPDVSIASPPFAPWLSIAVSKVKVTQHVVLGNNYVLESSPDLVNWTPAGPPFIAQAEVLTQEFDVQSSGWFFRLRQVP